MSLPRYPDDCPKQADCLERFAGQDSLCPGTVRDQQLHVDRTPLRPAELLCFQALNRIARRRSGDPFKESCKAADELIDRTLALPSDGSYSATRRAGFEAMAQLLDGITCEKDIYTKGRLKYHASATRLSLFLPAFRERAFDGSVRGATVRELHAGCVQWLAAFDTTYLRPIKRTDHEARKHMLSFKAEVEVGALLSRIGIVPYPATEREEASHARSEHNHDFYTLDEVRLRKTPVQVKTSKRAGGYVGVVRIVHHDILRALRETNTGYTDQSVTSLLHREQMLGKGGDLQVTNWLNLASMYVRSRLDTFTDFRIS